MAAVFGKSPTVPSGARKLRTKSPTEVTSCGANNQITTTADATRPATPPLRIDGVFQSRIGPGTFSGMPLPGFGWREECGDREIGFRG